MRMGIPLVVQRSVLLDGLRRRGRRGMFLDGRR